jgi:hypothetical protein
LGGCKSNDEIPEDDLVNIFHDAFIANAYLAKTGTIPNDSLIIYEPILEKYGYTIEEFRNTLQSLSQRKSARISKLLTQASDKLEAEAAIARRRIVVLDTIDNIAKRTFTRTIYQDSLIHVKRLKDTTKLRVSIKDIIPGDYTLSFNYFIDTLDENRNSRVEVYLLKNDSIQIKRHTQMLSRYKEGKFTRTFNVDTTMSEIYLNVYYHPHNEESKLPDITIRDFKIVRVLSTEQSVDSLYHTQLNLRIINHSMMSSFTADTVDIIDTVIPTDTIASDTTLLYGKKDSLTLHIN